MIALLLLFALLTISIMERVRILRIKSTQADFGEILGDSKSSMLSEAIANLVATAGGIYLSLILLATFLGLELPSTVEFLTMRFEPVAGTAILLALVQPFLQKIFNTLFN